MSAASPPADLPRPGDVIAGKYEVESILGAGGMGVVVAARHTALRQRVAVKFLLPAAMRLPEASARFLREAQAAVAIQSEHVARVHDVGTLESGAPYIVMEHLSGTNMSRVIKERGALPVEEALELALQAMEAIAEAHSLGIIHRDLKPANLFLTRRAEGSPLVKVLDFGLSKMALQEGAAPEASLTATGVVIGSAHYMSPEQVRSLKHVDQRTDVWALGVILYELLTGKRPFDGPSLPAICASVVADPPPPLRAWRPDLPAQLEAVLARCMEKDPARRLSSVAEIAAGLAPFAPARAWPSIERIGRLLPGAIMPALPARPPLGSSAEASRPQEAPAPPPQAPPTGPTLTLPTTAPGPSPEATTVQMGAWGETRPVAQRGPAGLIVAGLGVAAFGIGVGILGWLLFLRQPAGTTAAAPASAPVQESTSSERPPPRPTATVTASVETSPAAPPPAASSATPKPTATATATVTTTAAPRTPPAPAPKAKAAVRPIDRPD